MLRSYLLTLPYLTLACRQGEKSGRRSHAKQARRDCKSEEEKKGRRDGRNYYGN